MAVGVAERGEGASRVSAEYEEVGSLRCEVCGRPLPSIIWVWGPRPSAARPVVRGWEEPLPCPECDRSGFIEALERVADDFVNPCAENPDYGCPVFLIGGKLVLYDGGEGRFVVLRLPNARAAFERLAAAAEERGYAMTMGEVLELLGLGRRGVAP